MKWWFLIITMLVAQSIVAQDFVICGLVHSELNPLENVKVYVQEKSYGTYSDFSGNYSLKLPFQDSVVMRVEAFGYEPIQQVVLISEEFTYVDFELIRMKEIQEVIIAARKEEYYKSESTQSIDVYTPQFFKINPNPTVFESLQMINGVRPQINCNICNTGDIHINGMEGPYTMLLIDGMPIVSGLATVYGFNGIPQSIIERVEVIKGPSSTIFGSEAVGGVINVITKEVTNAPLISVELYGTSWGECNTDIATKFRVGKKARSFLGINYFDYRFPKDNNGDGFTDVALASRVSVFNKWQIARKFDRVFDFAFRTIYEDRWGGELEWNRSLRGGDSLYGESIYTNRYELFGVYQLPFKERFYIETSVNLHQQNSYYGTTFFGASQLISFAQLKWLKSIRTFDLSAGLSYRYTFYDDTTPATAIGDSLSSKNNPSNMQLPGLYFQTEWLFHEQQRLLVGCRVDYNSIHGFIFSPRVNYKWETSNQRNAVRIGVGNGYRIANVFTEDHAALTGGRVVEFASTLNPETSWNVNVNFTRNLRTEKSHAFYVDFGFFYSYFTNKIIPDYETDINKIIYDNLEGYAISRGLSFNINYFSSFGLKTTFGTTLMDVFAVENGVKSQQLFTENLSAVWTVSYQFKKLGMLVDYSGNMYSPMKLPLASSLDPRPASSPWFSIHNIQLTKAIKNQWEVFLGVKNFLNWTPSKGVPFLIARANDPFDKYVQYDTNQQVISTSDNPYALQFDPSYVYAPNQGIRVFIGFRWNFK
ncbi:MAG TPA: TonB-dependent receptor plug domain-containing protein [Taishania sp.]|nr:TonB-dependent receptor plug domain-containing protein [Taishania sp.]